MPNIRKRGETWQAQVRRAGYPALAKSFATRADAVAWDVMIDVKSADAMFVSELEGLVRLTEWDYLTDLGEEQE
jgi:hypothetical protein